LARARDIDALAADASTLAAARHIVPLYLEEIYAHAPAVHDPSAAHQHHRLRIAAKRLRYVMENFAFLFPEFEDFIANVRKIQDLLGRVRDCDVFAAFFEDFLADRRAQIEDELGLALAGEGSTAQATLEDVRRTLAARDAEGERQAVLRLLERTRARRLAAFAEFQAVWLELERREFRREILAVMSRG
jgi:CHAD domain-containing protein